MHRVLHILTRPHDPLATRLVQLQNQNSQWETVTIDLTRDDVDYEMVLDEIFAADSVQVY